MVHVRLVAIIITLLLLTGCKEEGMHDPINSIVEMRLWEAIEQPQPTLEIYLRTKEFYPCMNYSIANSVSRNSRGIHIKLHGIEKDDMCLTAPGPATAKIDLGRLPNGRHKLNIRVGHALNEGQIIVQSDRYVIEFIHPIQLEVSEPQLMRIPMNTIWGLIGYHNVSTVPVVQTFLDSLAVLGASARSYAPGRYGYFQVDGKGRIMTPPLHGYHFARPYVFEFAHPSGELAELVRRFGVRHGGQLNISLHTAQGEVFYSWLR